MTRERMDSAQGTSDAALDWMALYVPSWGTSVLLHVALLILAAFVVWSRPAAALPDIPPVGAEWTRQRSVRERHHPQLSERTARKRDILEKPNVYRFIPNLVTLPNDSYGDLPEVPADRAIGRESWPRGGGPRDRGPESLDPGPGGRGGTRIFDVPEEARKIVYVVDRSGSMTDSIDDVQWELKRSIWELGEEKEFHVIFYSSGPPLEMPTRRLVSATDRNKEMAFEFIEGIIAEGETDPSKALERAFAVRPELIYLLTDGEFDKSIVGLVRRLNAAAKVKVHTIAFRYRIGEAVLKEIADGNGGNYKFVSGEDL